MAQQEYKILPKYVNTDASFSDLQPNETPHASGFELTINANPDLGIGLNNPTGEGQNVLTLTPSRSNIVVPDTILPSGINIKVGDAESPLTNEFFYFNKNSNGNDGIYVIEGNTGLWKKVIEDPELAFTDDPEGFIAEHRVSLRVILNKKGEVIEKILMLTDGKRWQKWILVNAAILTNGFDASLYPYFIVPPPHFDRRELLEWAERPIMYNPIIETIPNTDADKGLVNRLIDSAFQVSVVPNYTDGRTTSASPYSLPLIINTSDYLNNPDNLPKKAKITIYAGGVWVESIDIYVRESKKQAAGIPSKITWSDWKWIDRVYKFGNDPNVLETPFWLRQNAWVNNNFNTTFNTIEYIFDNSKRGLIPLIDMGMIQNDLPQLSIAHASLANTEALCNNRYGYNNLTYSQLSKLDITVKEKLNILCPSDLATITVYGYVGMCGTDFEYQSQVGYYLGDDKTVRFGGLRRAPSGDTFDKATIDAAESKFFSLDFADKNSFRLYAKGTPYFADAKWVIVNTDNSITPIGEIYDFSNADTLQAIQTIFHTGAYFAMKWELKAPRGKYNLAVGRHNVASSGDYRSTSTYVYGIANSRIKTGVGHEDINGDYLLNNIRPNAIVSGNGILYSKEMEVDSTNGDVDVWGNNADMFYIYCPQYHKNSGKGNFRFIEGYFKEEQNNPLPVELFPYQMTKNNGDDWGKFTDKNGFYWAYTKARDSKDTDIEFVAKINCAYPTTFTIPTSQGGIGWKQNKVSYLSDNNIGNVGDCNRIIYRGKITDLTGLIGFSNIAISIKDGSTVTTRNDGTFELIIHSGQNFLRTSNVYVNAGGNFNITISNCGYIPLFNFTEPSCSDCTERRFFPDLNLSVNAEGGSQTSLKENFGYEVGIAAADLAGRLMYINKIKTLIVPSFLQRNNILATYFQALINGKIQFEEDLKWASFYVSKQNNILGYVDWVGDKLQYIDSNGNVVSDPGSAVFSAIYIDSFYNNNAANNFSLLASYQFTPNDRLRILDNGDGKLFDVATYGSEIDVQILGTNYNQAAQAAAIVPNVQNPIVNVNTNTTELNQSITLFVRYDARLDKLIGKTGFWIELYTPAQSTDKMPYEELTWKPIIKREIADFTGYGGSQPTYNYPAQIDIPYWDTYLFNRNINIPDVGNKFFNHPFNSPNVNDNWGANLTSGGREWVENPNAKQLWYPNDVIRSDSFIMGSFINGLGIFRSENRKDYVYNPSGGIVFMKVGSRGIVFFGCENDFYTASFQAPYPKADANGLLRVNPNNGLSEPNEKIGNSFGVSYQDHSSIIMEDDLMFWFDKKNEAIVLCDYKSAKDISDIEDKEGRKYGIKSYLVEKAQFISDWNESHKINSRFDVVSGIDRSSKQVYFTFRPRRINTNDLSSYVNHRRNIDIKHQETICFDYEAGRWLPNAKFTPEGYGKIRGLKTGIEMITFASGKPYYHTNTKGSFLNYYGIQTEPSLISVLNNDKDIVKIFQSMAQDILPNALYIDMIFDNELNSFSYLPSNMIVKKENVFYGSFLRDMSSYLSTDFGQSFRSTLQDGKRLFGRYLVVRFVGQPNELNNYFQLSNIFYEYSNSESNKK